MEEKYFTIKAEMPVDNQGNIIPCEVLKNSIEEYNERCAEKAYGFLQSCPDFYNDASKITHTIENVYFSTEGDICATILPVETHCGKLLVDILNRDEIDGPKFYVNGVIENGETDENGNCEIKSFFINSIDWC